MSVSASTSSVRAARQARSRSRSSGRLFETIDVASSAALIAPGSPMASVPTGTPFGICTIESSESSPLSTVAGTGTPSTGSVRLRGDHARQMRRAAGRGDDHLEAARLGRRRVLEHPVRRAMRRDDLRLVRHAELGEQIDRRLHVFRSELLPMITPTRG